MGAITLLEAEDGAGYMQKHCIGARQGSLQRTVRFPQCFVVERAPAGRAILQRRNTEKAYGIYRSSGARAQLD